MISKIYTAARHTLAVIVLAIYCVVSILGYGLHSLWDCKHHHQHGPHQTACCAGHGHLLLDTIGCSDKTVCQSDHHSAISHKDSLNCCPSIFADDSDCPICAFLAQVQTPIAAIVETAIVLCLPDEGPVHENITTLCMPRAHLARGPPWC